MKDSRTSAQGGRGRCVCVLRHAVENEKQPDTWEGKVGTEADLTGTCDHCQTRPPLTPPPGCGLLSESGAPAPLGCTGLSDAARLSPPPPWRRVALAGRLQDFGGKEQSAKEQECVVFLLMFNRNIQEREQFCCNIYDTNLAYSFQ